MVGSLVKKTLGLIIGDPYYYQIPLIFRDFHPYLDGGFKYVLFSPGSLGEMIQFDRSIVFKWVGSTTN